MWELPENPPYGYWMYFMYANICVLNKVCGEVEPDVESTEVGGGGGWWE